MNFRLEHTETLILLGVIPLLLFLYWTVSRWKKNAIRRIGDEVLVKKLVASHSPTLFFTKFLLATTALTLIIVASANLQEPGAMDPIERKGVDVMIAMDVSKSMLAQDLQPNRLEQARQLVQQLIRELPDDRIGLILFAGRAYLQMPLTTDHATAAMFVQNANPEVVPSQGTVISEALRLSNIAFNSKERKYKAIVLITDGEDHDPETGKLAAELASNGVIINTVGIGSPEGSAIPEPGTSSFKKDQAGNTVISKLNESSLQQLSESTNGVYVRLTDVGNAVEILKEKLGTIESTVVEDQAFRDYKSYFQWFLALALLILALEFFIPEKQLKLAWKNH